MHGAAGKNLQDSVEVISPAMPTIKMCDCPVILATASAASIRSLWLMRFIDREGVAKRVTGVALLHTGIFPEELF